MKIRQNLGVNFLEPNCETIKQLFPIYGYKLVTNYNKYHINLKICYLIMVNNIPINLQFFLYKR